MHARTQLTQLQYLVRMFCTYRNYAIAYLLGICLVSGILSACGSGSGNGNGNEQTIAPVVTSPPPDPNISKTTSYRWQNTPAPFNIGSFLVSIGINGYFFDARQYIDLDGDGEKEVVLAPGRFGYNATPVRVFKKTAGGNYEDATSSFFGNQIPSQIHARKLLSADFNSDGLLDLFILDHGYDANPYPGAQNTLMLSNRNTQLWERKEISGNPVAFHHCGSAGDVDNNGTVDLFVCGETWQGSGKGPYFLINDGNGNLSLSRQGIPTSLTGPSTGNIAAELVDIDDDGYLDLVVCYRDYANNVQFRATRIFWGKGTKSYSDSVSTLLPNPEIFDTTYDIKAEDIDGDGKRDLVLLKVSSSLTGYYFQILRQSAPRMFNDESISRIIKNADTWEGKTGGLWFPWLHLTDLNADGTLDLVNSESSDWVRSRLMEWSNDGRGNFEKLLLP